jgi:hypothetical protein
LRDRRQHSNVRVLDVRSFKAADCDTDHYLVVAKVRERLEVSILNRWKNYFSQLLNVHRVSDVKQIEMHTAELLVPDPSPFEVEIAIAIFKRYESPGSDKIPAELIIFLDS